MKILVLILLLMAGGRVGAGLATYLNGTYYSTNWIWLAPRWIDMQYGGLGFASNPSGDPPVRTEVAGSTGIYGVGFNAADNGDFAIQTQHGMAETNASFPNFWFHPHMHISATSVGGGNDVGFILRYQVAAEGSAYSSLVWLTNGVTFAQTGKHRELSWGYVTNNALQGLNSIIFRGNVLCQSNDTGGAVILDSFDFHIPLDSLGSSSDP